MINSSLRQYHTIQEHYLNKQQRYNSYCSKRKTKSKKKEHSFINKSSQISINPQSANSLQTPRFKNQLLPPSLTPILSHLRSSFNNHLIKDRAIQLDLYHRCEKEHLKIMNSTQKLKEVLESKWCTIVASIKKANQEQEVKSIVQYGNQLVQRRIQIERQIKNGEKLLQIVKL